MTSKMPKTRISRNTVYARWMRANDSLALARRDANNKAIVRYALRVATLSYTMAEYERDASERAAWRRLGNKTLEYVNKCQGGN